MYGYLDQDKTFFFCRECCRHVDKQDVIREHELTKKGLAVGEGL